MIFMRLHHVAYGEKRTLWCVYGVYGCYVFSIVFYFLFTTYEVRHSWKDEFRILF